MKLSGEELMELYLDRVYDTSEDLEDKELERAWMAQYGWTPEEFDKFLPIDRFVL